MRSRRLPHLPGCRSCRRWLQVDSEDRGPGRNDLSKLCWTACSRSPFPKFHQLAMLNDREGVTCVTSHRGGAHAKKGSRASCDSNHLVNIQVFAGEVRLLSRFVIACRSVNAGILHDEPFDRPAADYVRVDDLVHVIDGDMSVPDALGIDDQVRTVLALVEASGLIGANP